jgi:hypothetical protein
MLVGPFPVDLVIEQLTSVAELKLVGGAAALDAALSNPPTASPAAYVLSNEAGTAGGYSGQLAQPMQVALFVVLCVRHAGNAASGAEAAKTMRALERAVRTRLRKWSPPRPFGALWISDSGNDQYIAGQLMRQVVFRTDYRDQEEA